MQQKLSNILGKYAQRFKVRGPYFTHPPLPALCLSVVIPAFKEPDILTTLRSLAACQPTQGTVEVLIIINAPENASREDLETNKNTARQIRDWEREKPGFLKVLVIHEESLPLKFAGAGLARKIGMDEAALRWAMLGIDGPVLCLDADCTVSGDYLIAAQSSFADHAVKVGHFNFAHPYREESDPVLRSGIIQYELHLRCYIQGLKMAGYPFAIHTVGSCMAVRTSTYALSGGMNRRKAGEDFYFLHKLVPLGGWKQISATVFPSCRISDRVPFGTGKAQSVWNENPDIFTTYHPEIYSLLNPLFQSVPQWYKQKVNLEYLPTEIQNILYQAQFLPKILQMKETSNSQEVFLKRFWQFMDGFMVLKLTHFLRDQGLNNLPVYEVAKKLSGVQLSGADQMLEHFRELDRVHL